MFVVSSHSPAVSILPSVGLRLTMSRTQAFVAQKLR